MARKTKEEAEKTYKKIIEVALDVFYEFGYSRSTLNQIAEQAGFTRGAVYWHFKDKADIFKSLDEEMGKFFLENVNFASPIENFDDFSKEIINFFELLETNNRFRKYYELVYFKTEWSEEIMPVIKKYRNESKQYVSYLESVYKNLKKHKQISNDVEPALAALATAAFVEGITGLWLVDQTLFSMSEKAPKLLQRFFKSFAN